MQGDVHQCFSNFNVWTNQLGVLLNAYCISLGLGWHLRSYVSNKLLADMNSTGLGILHNNDVHNSDI